ncbi:diphosphomevalonate/mevalonate 3,5-bisphosphate decarboxylase family protein [Aequorivita viscosa]|uniref:Diphosphomevalonate decarboxylase n=1 Tax=Aequorivita viscosa TaxID=797419 RepID=A0A1M6L6Y8_9FLAO|nr:diphosphomevalonate decarboxylase [Aequorivita viscosa]SDX22690.1 diphosphomevalonate decarboxylase [Aequorivita viscosa]SHJ66956.1 diphosphomevalonate decarboxylase [Aequorivita viscosa]
MLEAKFIPKPYSLNLEKGSVSWQSPSNIALVKYWGKYGEQLPKNTSISFTLSNCHTNTKLSFEKVNASSKFQFEVFLDGRREISFEPKVLKFFERVQVYLPFLKDYKFRIETSNSFPHSSGIASSASGMSALALCLVNMEVQLQSGMDGQSLSEAEIQKASFLARLGSGSACRSLEGPLIVWGVHPEIEGSSNLFGTKFPFKIHPKFSNYRDCILLVDKGEKQVSSTVGHDLMHKHPFAEQRFEQAQSNLSKLIPILKNGDIPEFIKIVESEALSLHAMMLTSMPYFILMKPNTLEIINRIWEFRKKTNSLACFTLDAGANVHLLYPEWEAETVLQFIKLELADFCKNKEFIVDQVGFGATMN